MNTKTTLLFLFSILFLISACKKEDQQECIESDPLLGYWVNPQYDYSITTFEKSSEMAEDGYGISFDCNSEFIERKNVGWCGTPPITYGNYDGAWVQTDSIVNITVGYWGGTAKYHWQIISLDQHHLVIERISEEYE